MKANLDQAAKEYRELKQKADHYAQSLNLADVARKKQQMELDRLKNMLTKQ